MEVLIPALMVLAFALSSIFKQPEPPPKSVEQELGEAIGKYLKKGVKIRVEFDQDKD